MLEAVNYDLKDGCYYCDDLYFDGSRKSFTSEINEYLGKEGIWGTLFIQNIKYHQYQDEVYEEEFEGLNFDVSEIEYDIENHKDTISFIIDNIDYICNRKKIDDFMNAYSIKKFTPTVRLTMDFGVYTKDVIDAFPSTLTIKPTYDNKIKLEFSVFRIRLD